MSRAIKNVIITGVATCGKRLEWPRYRLLPRPPSEASSSGFFSGRTCVFRSRWDREPFAGAPAAMLRIEARARSRAQPVSPQCVLITTAAGWPGSLNRFPVSVMLVPSTLRMEMSWSR